MEKVFSKTQRAESTCHMQIGLQQTKIEVSTKTSKKKQQINTFQNTFQRDLKRKKQPTKKEISGKSEI